MSVTAQYTATHEAFARTAVLMPGVTGFDVRMVVALRDAGGAARTDELEALLGKGGMASSAIRRSVPILKRFKLVEANGDDGGKTRPGIRTRLSLTELGEAVAARAICQAQSPDNQPPMRKDFTDDETRR